MFILGALRFSKEGLKHKIKIKGLSLAYLKEIIRYLLTGIKYKFLKSEEKIPEKEQGKIKSISSSSLYQIPDDFYVAFEEIFRGKEEDVKGLFKCYLPLVKEAKQRINDFKLVDLGCGRGEFLELLMENDIPCIGVEKNLILCQKVREKGIKIIEEDIFSFLDYQPCDSIGAVSAIHVIEHLTLDMQFVLLKEILRILKPGGIAIIETPNPRNILVSAGDFFRDPTHIKPIFPDTLEFMGKYLGFSQSTSYFFQNDREALIPVSEVKFPDLYYINVSRDYVWLGVK